MTFAILLYLVVVAIFIIANWKVYTKAGKPGWACLIPIYNIIVLLEIVGKPWWWTLLILFVPVANIIFLIWMLNLLSKSFGKGIGMTILLIIGIGTLILGFGSATYKGAAGK